MNKRALVIGHADGDGHIATEQSRRNLAAEGWTVDTLVDPQRTRNWRLWSKHLQTLSFSKYGYVVFVDLMWPAKHDDAITAWGNVRWHAHANPDTAFLVIDHHELPSTAPAPNVTFVRSPTVFDCCYGSPTEMMLVAAICDKDEEPVAGKLTAEHRRRAVGIKRAVTDRRGLAGHRVLSYLAEDRWDVFERLADEPADYHRTLYGNRVEREPSSPTLKALRLYANG